MHISTLTSSPLPRKRQTQIEKERLLHTDTDEETRTRRHKETERVKETRRPRQKESQTHTDRQIGLNCVDLLGRCNEVGEGGTRETRDHLTLYNNAVVNLDPLMTDLATS